MHGSRLAMRGRRSYLGDQVALFREAPIKAGVKKAHLSPTPACFPMISGISMSSGRNNHSNDQKLTIGCWNVHILLDLKENRALRRTALVAKDLHKYQLDITALLKTRLHDSDVLREKEYALYRWGYKANQNASLPGIGFKLPLLINYHSSLSQHPST